MRGWYQVLKDDWHDWDVAAAPVLIKAGGRQALLAVAGKDGLLHGIDPETWRLRFQAPVAARVNVEAPPTVEGTRFCPGVNGGVEWNGPSYSPLTGLLYVGATEWCTTVKVMPPDSLRGRDGLPWTGSADRFKPFGTPDSVRRGRLTAVSADDGRVRWRYDSPTPLVAGMTATAGGLVFTGDLEGNILALDAERGTLLWRDSTGLPVGGGVVSYAAAGRQRIAIAAGLHAPVTWRLESGPAELLVYALP